MDKNKLIDNLIKEDDNTTIRDYLDVKNDINNIKHLPLKDKTIIILNDCAYNLWNKNYIK